jgi:hypothetical protein
MFGKITPQPLIHDPLPLNQSYACLQVVALNG